MPYRMEASGGSNGVPAGSIRTITAGFAGTDQLTFSGSLSGGAAGDLIEIRGATSGNGNYIIIESISATVKRVQPTPPNLGGPGAATGQGIDRGATERKGGVDAVTAYPATNQLTAATATFVTDGVRPNDHVVIGAGGTTTNEGTFVVASVIDETNITVRGNPLTAAVPVGDTVTIYRAHNVIIIEDETAATMAAIIAGLTFFQANWGIATDYITALGVAGAGIAAGVGEAYTIDGVLEYRLVSTTGATVTELNIENEVWINPRSGEGGFTNISTAFFNGEVISGSVASPMLVNIGTRAGDTLSGRDGSMLYGIHVGNFGTTRVGADDLNVMMWGSACKVERVGGNSFASIDGASELLTSIIMGQALSWPTNLGSAGILVVESLSHITEQGFGVFRGDADISNLVLNAPVGQFLASAPNAVVAGLLKSDVSAQPLFAFFGSSGARFLNPREDYPLSELGAEFFPGTSPDFGKSYTFNPRFVSRDTVGNTGSPISGLIVEISEINETTQVATAVTGSPFTTDANGQINSGAGVELDRQKLVSTTIRDFSHRLEVEGAGFRRIDQVVQITEPFSADVAVDFLQPDFEEEFAT